MDFLLQSYSRFSLALLFFLLLALPILGGQAAWGEAAGRSLSSPGRTPDHTSASLPPSGGPGAELSPIVAGYYPYYARMDGFLPGDLAAQHLTTTPLPGWTRRGGRCWKTPAWTLPTLPVFGP